MTELQTDSVLRAAKALMEMGVSVRAGEWDECVSAASIALAASEKITIE
jgi:hypothetical protein